VKEKRTRARKRRTTALSPLNHDEDAVVAISLPSSNTQEFRGRERYG
jgi:hypothetical protein